MKNIFISTLFLFSFISLFSQAQNPEWSRQFNPSTIGGSDRYGYSDLAIDNKGNIFCVGHYLPSGASGNQQDTKFIISRFDPTGNLMWEDYIDFGNSFATFSQVTSIVSAPGGNDANIIGGEINNDAFLSYLIKNKSVRKANIEMAPGGHSIINKIIIHKNKLYVVGNFNGTLIFNDQAGNPKFTFSSKGTFDAFIASFHPVGLFIHDAIQLSDVSPTPPSNKGGQYCHDLEVGPDGRLYVVGESDGDFEYISPSNSVLDDHEINITDPQKPIEMFLASMDIGLNNIFFTQKVQDVADAFFRDRVDQRNFHPNPLWGIPHIELEIAPLLQNQELYIAGSTNWPSNDNFFAKYNYSANGIAELFKIPLFIPSNNSWNNSSTAIYNIGISTACPEVFVSGGTYISPNAGNVYSSFYMAKIDPLNGSVIDEFETVLDPTNSNNTNPLGKLSHENHVVLKGAEFDAHGDYILCGLYEGGALFLGDQKPHPLNQAYLDLVYDNQLCNAKAFCVCQLLTNSHPNCNSNNYEVKGKSRAFVTKFPLCETISENKESLIVGPSLICETDFPVTFNLNRDIVDPVTHLAQCEVTISPNDKVSTITTNNSIIIKSIDNSVNSFTISYKCDDGCCNVAVDAMDVTLASKKETDFSLITENPSNSTQVKIIAKAQNYPNHPALVHQWQIFKGVDGASSCEILGENTGQTSSYLIHNEYDTSTSPAELIFSNLSIGVTYVIKHGIYYEKDGATCGWWETRKCFRMDSN